MAAISPLFSRSGARGLPCQGLQGQGGEGSRVGEVGFVQCQGGGEAAEGSDLALQGAAVTELEAEGGQVFFGDVKHGFPAVESVVDEGILVRGQTETLEDVWQSRHGPGWRRDRRVVHRCSVKPRGAGRGYLSAGGPWRVHETLAMGVPECPEEDAPTHMAMHEETHISGGLMAPGPSAV